MVVLLGSSPNPSHPLSRQQVNSLSQSFCVSPVELIDRGEGGGGRSQIIRPRESLVLHTPQIHTVRNLSIWSNSLTLVSTVWHSSDSHLFWFKVGPGRKISDPESGSGSAYRQADVKNRSWSPLLTQLPNKYYNSGINFPSFCGFIKTSYKV